MRWITAKDLAFLWGVPLGTVHRWISKDAKKGEPWPRTRTQPYRYDPEAAQDRHDHWRGEPT